MLKPGKFYTREELWSLQNPGEPFPKDGNWLTDYFREGDSLLIFVDLNTPGKTGHAFSNTYDSVTGLLEWFGKPNANSAQPFFKALFRGSLIPRVFVRWDTEDSEFLFLGTPAIKSYMDGQKIGGGIVTLKVHFVFSPSQKQLASPPPEGLPLAKLEGGRISVQVNRYERDPRLRSECLKAYGAICRICDFNFENTYGDLGAGYIHIHHIKPLAEADGKHLVDPILDMIPVCPNCHAMLHGRTPALMPDELKLILKQHRLKS